jgi:tetratricopeptide (TPR) repeat protein
MTDLRDDLQAALGSAYTLERELGGGGMSRVFVAEETALGRKVVVKVLSPDLTAGVNVDRFRREIQVAAKLQQAQILPVLSAGDLRGVPYYTMPYIEGESLRAKIAHTGALPISEVVNVLRDVTRALAYAHEHGVVHRDIKPDNVLLSGGTAVVTDFGIAKAIAAAGGARADGAGDGSVSALTQLGMTVGTPLYISPEQASGDPDIDQRSDIYSLGCLAYELLTGHPPFAGRSQQKTIVAHLTETPRPVAEVRPDVPASLAAVVMQCLEKDPARRPQSAAEVQSALDSVTTANSGQLPVTLLSGPGGLRRGFALYAGVFALVALVAKAAVVAFGLPEWVFTGAVIVMALGLPAAVLTAMGTTHHLTWRRTFRGAAIALGAFTAVVAAIMILRLFGIGPAASLLAAGKLHGSERLIVTDFAAGKDSSLSHIVTEAVRTSLGQSKVVSIMPPTAIAAALQRMQRPPSTTVDLSLAREIALREGAKAVVTGSVATLGNGYVVSLRLVSADSGNDLAAYQKTANGPADLLTAIDDLTRKLRGRIGESLRSVRDAPPLDQVTTSSLEALRKYAEAQRANDLQGDMVKAGQLLREAVALDTTFAMAYRKLGVTLGNLGMPRAQVDSALTRAFRYSDRLPPKERYLTIGTYYSNVPHLDRLKAAEAYQSALSLDSTDVTAAINLAGILRSLRQFARAESLYKMVNAARASSASLGNYASMLLVEGRVAASESVFREMARRIPTAGPSQTFPAVFMFARGELDSAEAFWQAKANDPNALMKLTATANLTNYALMRGRLGDAEQLGRQTRALNAARGVPSSPVADSLVSAAVSIWFLDKPAVGVHALDVALAQAPFRTVPLEARPYETVATFYAWGGRPDKARAILAQELAEVTDPGYRLALEPGRRGALANILMAEKKPVEAIREIWASDSLPDGPVSDCVHCIDFDLGRAYDLANKPDSAIAHWERYLSEPYARSPSRDAPFLAGMHKRLAELYDAKGDLNRAASHYAAFIELWKNADPALQPKVQEAKRRLSEIQTKEKR